MHSSRHEVLRRYRWCGKPRGWSFGIATAVGSPNPLLDLDLGVSRNGGTPIAGWFIYDGKYWGSFRYFRKPPYNIYIMDGLLPRVVKHCKGPSIGCYHTILLETDFFVGFPLQRHWSSWQCGRRKGGPFSFQVYWLVGGWWWKNLSLQSPAPSMFDAWKL